jgi:hypothetical protein
LRQVEDRRIAQRRHRNRGAVPDQIMWYDIQMIKVLEQAIEKIKSLSVERQEYAASVLEQIVESGDDLYRLTEEERQLVNEGLAELDRGEVATTEEVRAVFDKYRI